MIRTTLYSQSPICDTASAEMSKRNGRFRSAARMDPAAAFCVFMDLVPFAVPVLSLFTVGLRGPVSHRPAAVTGWSPGLRFPACSPRGRADPQRRALGADASGQSAAGVSGRSAAGGRQSAAGGYKTVGGYPPIEAENDPRSWSTITGATRWAPGDGPATGDRRPQD